MKHRTHLHVQLHAIDRRPRSSLDRTKHASIDAVLKDLKFCARHLQTSLKAQLDEAQILERLYYKGKNQHRGALFWRRVVEMRRFCNRIDGVQIDVVVDAFYRSFFGEKLGIGSKTPNGAWTHLPDTAFVDFVLARLTACSDLLKKMHSRLLDAYRSFTLVMKSGAFLQLTLTLAAIASRMGTMSSELQDVLGVTKTVTQKALLIVTSLVVESPLCVINNQPSQSELVGISKPDLSCCHNPPLSTVCVERANFNKTHITVPSEYPQLPPQVVIEYKAHRQAPSSESERKGRKRKHTVTKDEIDAIFGF